LTDRRWQSSILDVRSLRVADCDTDQCLGVAKFGEKLAVSKQAAQKFEREIFNLRKLNELEVRKQYQRQVSGRFAVWENSNVSKDINMAWENVKESNKTSAKESLGSVWIEAG
jgi:hypothetical protein